MINIMGFLICLHCEFIIQFAKENGICDYNIDYNHKYCILILLIFNMKQKLNIPKEHIDTIYQMFVNTQKFKTNFGEDFYKKLIGNDPILKNMFFHVHFNNLGVLVLELFSTIAERIKMNLNWQGMVLDVAYKHKDIEIKPEHYTNLKSALLSILTEYDKSDKFLCNHNFPVESFTILLDAVLKEFQKGVLTKISDSDFTKKELNELTHFFSIIAVHPFNFGEAFYKDFIGRDPELDDMFKNVHKSNLGFIMLQLIITILNHIKEEKDWRPLMRDIAHKHSYFVIKNIYYDYLIQSFKVVMQEYAKILPKQDMINLPLVELLVVDIIHQFRNELIAIQNPIKINEKTGNIDGVALLNRIINSN